LVRLLERHRNSDVERRGRRGASAGIWWASVTLFTVEYGDAVLRRLPSRVVTITWMFTGVLFVAAPSLPRASPAPPTRRPGTSLALRR
jgi:hypothetical protein